MAESTHVAFFDKNVAGVMRGQEGPYVARVEEFLMAKLDFGNDEIRFRPLPHPSIADQMKRVDYLRRFTIKVPADRGDALPDGAPGLRSILTRARERYGTVDIELTIKVPTRNADRSSDAVLDEIRAIIAAGTVEVLNKASMTYLDHRTEKGDDFDFLSQKIAMGVEVEMRGRSRTVREDSASEKIQEAYDALHSDIRRSLGG